MTTKRKPREQSMVLRDADFLRVLMDKANDGLGASFADVGTYAGVRREFIWQLTSGRRTSCQAKVASRIAGYLGVQQSLLFMPRVSTPQRHIVTGARP